MPITTCRFFNGYKPCGKNTDCCDACPSKNIPSSRILIIHLEALGAVLRSTALLAPIKRKFPNSHITWITQKPAEQLLLSNPLIDLVLNFEMGDILALQSLKFDATFCIDKSLKACALANQIQTELLYGFKTSDAGAILPATDSAEELWSLGLSDQKKFFENEKTENQLICEALELGPYSKDHYLLKLSPSEKSESQKRREEWAPQKQTIIGINTGCSHVISYKKLSVEAHRLLIEKISEQTNFKIVLLGGKEDSARNALIAKDLDVIQSPTEQGLRDGIISIEACDILVSGDSLGMHIGIALQKWSVAWFGPTCSQEIELYDHGIKVLSQAPCGPCWKRVCDKTSMCYDLVSTDELFTAIMQGQAKILDGNLNSHAPKPIAPPNSQPNNWSTKNFNSSDGFFG
jgi:heptosyltransferase-2